MTSDMATSQVEGEAGNAKATGEAALVERLAARLSMPPSGNGAELAGDDARAAARFLLSIAADRRDDEPAIAIDSVSGPVGARKTRIAVVNNDMPFLVDSMAMTIAAFGLAIDRLIHPIMAVQRDAGGRLIDLPEGEDAEFPQESIVYIETERADAKTRVALGNALRETLAEVRAAVRDWPKLQAAMVADAGELARRGGRSHAEEAALLRWLCDDNLTQLGHVTRRREGGETERLGICAVGDGPFLPDTSYERAFAWFDEQPTKPLLVVKANRISRVHRRVPLDVFAVPLFEQGNLVAVSVHVGIWTSAALAAPPVQVPVLRRELETMMGRFGFAPHSHAGKALVHALTRLPHDELLGFVTYEVERVATTMISLIDRPRPHLVLVRSPLERHLFAFVWLPRDALSTDVREHALSMISEAADAKLLDWTLEVDGALATIRALYDIGDDAPAIDEAPIAARLRAVVRGWPDAVEAALVEAGETPGRAAALAARYADAFPQAYRGGHGAAEAAADIRRLMALGDGTDQQGRDARLRHVAASLENEVQLKLYQRRGALPLSDAVPMLENFGFRVIGEVPTLLGDELGSIHDFQLELPRGSSLEDIVAREREIERAIAAVLVGEAEDDPFNRLIPAVALGAREANWLRAFYRYMRQTGLNFGIGTVVDALAGAPDVARGLVALFVARHDPARKSDREKEAAQALETIRQGLANVSAINDDRLLRRYEGVVEAIVRTNAFMPVAKDASEIALAFKFESGLVSRLPKPVPWREIFVHSRRVEGIHLRAGPVARGGLRWSDRRDDFRTEILGLMKAQRVKNAVIVPTGAKGGFYPKHLPDPALDREGWAAEGKASYQLFVRSLLSLTDNIVGGEVVHPKGMVIRDGDDPYFVVAADKGTATFSDVANAIAAERDFWLDDAFASGGSKGYDHKAMAITARGAWLSVRRHFLEHGVDIQSETVRVVGCGDMSGDVFGNGMLLSHAIQLVAAFDHRHIFLDPDPDPLRSYEERKRLFALPRSSWDDYDRHVISKGGGVFPRSQKAIPLSPEIGRVLGIPQDSADPETLIRAILTSPVDLLWFGGIGTYVKAASENNVAVGDPANDALRVDAGEVRARVIGEGANLGVTQAGRIEYALSGAGAGGGRINADFIDNSAGVDCSDHEVNIKIALASARRDGRLDEDGRVALLGAMTDEVAALVLEDNRLQALALSIAQAGGPNAVPSYLRLIDVLEESGQIDRRGDGLADSGTLSRRAFEGRGLTRPELAVVLSSAKLALHAALGAVVFPDDPMIAGELLAAFPQKMRGAYERDILSHRLRHQIVATRLANRVINRMGLVHPFELIEEEGVSPEQFATAFLAAERLFRMGPTWRAIETARMPEAARVLLFDRAAAALRPHIADLLRTTAGRTAPSVLVEELEAGIDRLFDCAPDSLGQESLRQSEQLRQELVAAGAPETEAALVADLYDLDGAVGIAGLSHRTGVDTPRLAAAFVEIGGRLGLDWAQGKAARMNPSDPWERLLVAGLARDFQYMRLQFLERVAAGGDPEAGVARWAEEEAPAIARFRATVHRAQGAVAASPSMLAQLASQARSLLAR
jgi:glutamate dehydrogenase